MRTQAFVSLMEAIAPTELAESWDNVGVLLEPLQARSIERVLLTIDLTGAVMSEAIELEADAIVAYHPPVFEGLKRLSPSNRTARLVLRALAAGVLVYSPHTALDAAPGGLNDWLSGAFDARSSSVILKRPPANAEVPAVGQGRILTLRNPRPLAELVADVKAYLNLSSVRLATASVHQKDPVKTVALCPGAGGSVLSEVSADLFLTGEMRHHDVLARVETGTSVLLTEHTNSERGYLPVLANRLSQSGLLCHVSQRDRDPLQIA